MKIPVLLARLYLAAWKALPIKHRVPVWVCTECGEDRQDKIDTNSSIDYSTTLCYTCAKKIDDSYIEYCKQLPKGPKGD